MVCNSGLVFGSGNGIYRLVKNCKVISLLKVKLPCFPAGIAQGDRIKEAWGPVAVPEAAAASLELLGVAVLPVRRRA